MSTERFFTPVFVHHRAEWHQAPETYCGGGADTACGLKNVGDVLLALNPLLTPTVHRFREAACAEFGSRLAWASFCLKCFPGLVGVRGGATRLGDVLAPEAAS